MIEDQEQFVQVKRHAGNDDLLLLATGCRYGGRWLYIWTYTIRLCIHTYKIRIFHDVSYVLRRNVYLAMYYMYRVVPKRIKYSNKYVLINTLGCIIRIKHSIIRIIGWVIRINRAFLFEGRYIFRNPIYVYIPCPWQMPYGLYQCFS
jgi:hypothetical protein